MLKRLASISSAHWELLPIALWAAIMTSGIFFPRHDRISSNETILITSDSVSMTPSERDSRLLQLLNSLHAHLGFITQNTISNSSLKMQGRIFFLTIFAVLITALLSGHLTEHPKLRTWITLLALGFGSFWYFVNTHLSDIEGRLLPGYDMIYNTEQKLMNVTVDDYRWYSLDFTKYDAKVKELETGHRHRKMVRFIKPDFEDILFNLSPMFILAILSWIMKHSLTRPTLVKGEKAKRKEASK